MCGMPAVKVLVVDDEQDTRKLVRLTLERRGWTVKEAAGGEEALQLLGQEHFDLVLLDIMMPRVSGYDVLQRMRSDERHNTKVVFLTAKGRSDEVDYGLELGADGYIVKPFSTRELFDYLSGIMAA
jgi:DNA-binding response OmpR family regulator